MEKFSEYQTAAAHTGGSDLLPANHDKGLNCAAMGLAGEAGEVCDLVKKVQHHRQPLDEAKLRKELGDVLWYIAHACNVMGWKLDDIAAANVEKLRARYPEGFNTADSIARRDEADADRAGRIVHQQINAAGVSDDEIATGKASLTRSDVEAVVEGLAATTPGLYTIPKLKETVPALGNVGARVIDSALKRMSTQSINTTVRLMGPVSTGAGGTYNEWAINARQRARGR